MTREVKDHDTRKQEILDAARDLFLKKGFSNVSVSEIIDSVGIAKGTLYHYFRSKEDILDELMHIYRAERMAAMKPIFEDNSLTLLEKMGKLAYFAEDTTRDKDDWFSVILEIFYKDSNLLFRNKLKRNILEVFKPDLTHLIKQGIKEGVFDKVYAEETVELILQIDLGMLEKVSIIIFDEKNKKVRKEKLSRVIKTHKRAIKKILGFSVKNMETIHERIINALAEKEVRRRRQ